MRTLILILILILIVIYMYINKKTYPKKWIVLLTTCIIVPNNDINKRIDLYVKQINKWLNETDMDIFVVESSGNGQILKDNCRNKRLHVLSLNIAEKLNSSSQYEAISILYALNEMSKYKCYEDSTYVLKVTGKYFIPDICDKLKQTENTDSDLFLQSVRTPKWQNSEYYGIRKNLFRDFIQTIDYNSLMEQKLYDYSMNHSFTLIKPFSNNENISRGDGSVLNLL